MIATDLHENWTMMDDFSIEYKWFIINEKWRKFIHDDVDNVGVHDTMYQTCSQLINDFVKKNWLSKLNYNFASFYGGQIYITTRFAKHFHMLLLNKGGNAMIFIKCWCYIMFINIAYNNSMVRKASSHC